MRELWLVGLLGLAVTLCSPSRCTAQSSLPGEDGYAVGSGDVLRVSSFEHKEISGEFQVTDQGTITYPLLGQVSVAGMSVSDVAALLERELEKDFFVNVSLTVDVKEFRSKPVTVLGEVRNPGTYFLKGRTTLTQMLANIGGFSGSAGGVLELRRVETGEDGAPVQRTYTYDLSGLVARGEGENVVLEGGDILWVPAKQLYFVTGEVPKPGRYGIEPGLTLLQALSQAGGQDKFASNVVEVHREVDGEKQIIEFDVSDIRKGRIEDPPVRSGDMIVVKRRFF